MVKSFQFIFYVFFSSFVDPNSERGAQIIWQLLELSMIYFRLEILFLVKLFFVYEIFFAYEMSGIPHFYLMQKQRIMTLTWLRFHISASWIIGQI